MAKYGTVKEKDWGKLTGNEHMFGFKPTGTQVPDRSSQEGHSGSRRGIAPDAGGNKAFVQEGSKHGREMSDKPLANRFGAGPQEAGTSSPSNSRQPGFAKGGSTKMFGNTGSRRCEPGKSAC